MLWAATVIGNTGTFMRDVASSWLVADLSGSAAAVAMVQAAGSLPVFLLAIPPACCHDILDRRRFLIVVQIGLEDVQVQVRRFHVGGAALPSAAARPLSH